MYFTSFKKAILLLLFSARVGSKRAHGYQDGNRGLTGGFLLLRTFSVTISVSPHVCFILV